MGAGAGGGGSGGDGGGDSSGGYGNDAASTVAHAMAVAAQAANSGPGPGSQMGFSGTQSPANANASSVSFGPGPSGFAGTSMGQSFGNDSAGAPSGGLGGSIGSVGPASGVSGFVGNPAAVGAANAGLGQGQAGQSPAPSAAAQGAAGLGGGVGGTLGGIARGGSPAPVGAVSTSGIGPGPGMAGNPGVNSQLHSLLAALLGNPSAFNSTAISKGVAPSALTSLQAGFHSGVGPTAASPPANPYANQMPNPAEYNIYGYPTPIGQPKGVAPTAPPAQIGLPAGKLSPAQQQAVLSPHEAQSIHSLFGVAPGLGAPLGTNSSGQPSYGTNNRGERTIS